jgi:hypothetical protein
MKRKKLDAIDLAEAENATSLIAVQPPSLQADYLAEMQIQAMPKMSSIEMEDFRIAGELPIFLLFIRLL